MNSKVWRLHFRVSLVQLLLLGLYLFLVTVVGDAVETPEKPDVLFIVVDDLSDWISLLDPESPIKTPNLERLARRGTLFTKAYCVSPACNPSRTAALTGLRPFTTGVYGNRSDWRSALPDRKTIMERYIDAGYDVRGAGKVFHHQFDGAFHDEPSFHEFRPMQTEKLPREKLNGAPRYGTINTDWGEWPSRIEDTPDFQTANYCIETLGASPGNKPLFLTCGIFRPHGPFFAPSNYHDAYRDMKLPLRNEKDWDDIPMGAKTLLRLRRWYWNGLMRVERQSPGSFHDYVRSYAACAALADEQIGRVLDALDASPRRDNTIVLLWSDHGFHLGEKDHLSKFALWEKATRIPFIVIAPGITQAGSRCVRPVDMSVLYPTLLELCGLPAAESCDGESIVPLLRDPQAEWEQPALMTYLRGNHAVRSDRWRYIRYSDGTEELYDHDSDPLEWTNLAGDRRFAKIKEDHRKWLPTEEAQRAPNLKKPSSVP